MTRCKRLGTCVIPWHVRGTPVLILEQTEKQYWMTCILQFVVDCVRDETGEDGRHTDIMAATASLTKADSEVLHYLVATYHVAIEKHNTLKRDVRFASLSLSGRVLRKRRGLYVMVSTSAD